MPLITELDVINDMLSSLGETPLNELDDEHPYVNAGRRMLTFANLREQAKVWWFNREAYTLIPEDATGNILLPEDTISIDPTDQSLNYVIRGNKLYRADAPVTEDKYVFTRSVDLVLVRLVPFEELPPNAAVYISYAAQKDFQKAYDADELKYKQIKADLIEARIVLMAEHVRNVGANLFKRTSTARTLGRLQSSGNVRYNLLG
jgi:hypothetical protein